MPDKNNHCKYEQFHMLKRVDKSGPISIDIFPIGSIYSSLVEELEGFEKIEIDHSVYIPLRFQFIRKIFGLKRYKKV